MGEENLRDIVRKGENGKWYYYDNNGKIVFLPGTYSYRMLAENAYRNMNQGTTATKQKNSPSFFLRLWSQNRSKATMSGIPIKLNLTSSNTSTTSNNNTSTTSSTTSNTSTSSNRMVWDPTSRRFVLNASTLDNTVTYSNPVKPVVKPEDKKIVTETPTYHVGGLNISDGIQQGVGLTPEVDMLGLTKSPTTDSETTPQPDYMRFINPVMPYVLNYFGALNNTTKFPIKELPVEGLKFNKVYNKKDTRQWLWDLGIDPYTLTGRQRRKIRNDLNTTGTTNFKINGVTPIAMKKGSKLIKKEEVCPKCGKIHKAEIGCTVAKFRYDNGGSLNRIPFYQGGTPKGGVKRRNKAKEFYYPTKESTLEKLLNHFVSQGLEIPEGRTEPGKFEYFLVDGLKLPPRIVKPVFDGLYNTGNFIKEILSQPIVRESPYERVNKIINPIIKFINK